MYYQGDDAMRNITYSNDIHKSDLNPNESNYNEIYNIFIQIIQDLLSHQEQAHATECNSQQQGDDTNE